MIFPKKNWSFRNIKTFYLSRYAYNYFKVLKVQYWTLNDPTVLMYYQLSIWHTIGNRYNFIIILIWNMDICSKSNIIYLLCIHVIIYEVCNFTENFRWSSLEVRTYSFYFKLIQLILVYNKKYRQRQILKYVTIVILNILGRRQPAVIIHTNWQYWYLPIGTSVV